MLDFAAAGVRRRIGPKQEMKIVLAIDPAQPLAAYRDALLAAVQWHPENLVSQPSQRALFEAFLEAVRQRAARPNPHASAGERADGAASGPGGHQHASGEPGGPSVVRATAGAPEPR